MNVCGARFARGLHVITFNREDADERARADACYRKMSEEVAERGVFVGRAPVDYHDFHMAQAMPAFRAGLRGDQERARSERRDCARALRHQLRRGSQSCCPLKSGNVHCRQRRVGMLWLILLSETPPTL